MPHPGQRKSIAGMLERLAEVMPLDKELRVSVVPFDEPKADCMLWDHEDGFVLYIQPNLPLAVVEERLIHEWRTCATTAQSVPAATASPGAQNTPTCTAPTTAPPTAMTDDRNLYLTNDLETRAKFARQLETLAELVRSGEFEHVCIAWRRPGRPDATLILTGPDSNDYRGAIAAIEELGVRARVAQQRSSLTE